EDYDDTPRKKRSSNTALVVILSILGAVFAIGCLGIVGCVALIRQASHKQQQEAAEVATAPGIKITAEALHAEDAANEVAADGKYRGKIIEVTGVVEEIGKGFGDQYVNLERGNLRIAGVRCSFPDSAREQLAKLKKGQTVTIKGRGNGFLVGEVGLKDCIL